MSVLKTAVNKGFEFPKVKTALFYPILRDWLETEKGIAIRSIKSSIRPNMYYYSINNEEKFKCHTSEAQYISREAAVHSAVEFALDSFL